MIVQRSISRLISSDEFCCCWLVSCPEWPSFSLCLPKQFKEMQILATAGFLLQWIIVQNLHQLLILSLGSFC